LVEQKHLLFVVSTQHLQETASLEEETRQRCLNYNVDADFDPATGEIKRDFLLKRGTSTTAVNIGPELFRRAFAKIEKNR